MTDLFLMLFTALPGLIVLLLLLFYVLRTSWGGFAASTPPLLPVPSAGRHDSLFEQHRDRLYFRRGQHTRRLEGLLMLAVGSWLLLLAGSAVLLISRDLTGFNKVAAGGVLLIFTTLMFTPAVLAFWRVIRLNQLIRDLETRSCLHRVDAIAQPEYRWRLPRSAPRTETVRYITSTDGELIPQIETGDAPQPAQNQD